MDIKPCPFCESTDVRHESYLTADYGLEAHRIECWGCGSRSPERNSRGEDRESVIKKLQDLWNGASSIERLQRNIQEGTVLMRSQD